MVFRIFSTTAGSGLVGGAVPMRKLMRMGMGCHGGKMRVLPWLKTPRISPDASRIVRSVLLFSKTNSICEIWTVCSPFPVPHEQEFFLNLFPDARSKQSVDDIWLRGLQNCPHTGAERPHQKTSQSRTLLSRYSPQTRQSQKFFHDAFFDPRIRARPTGQLDVPGGQSHRHCPPKPPRPYYPQITERTVAAFWSISLDTCRPRITFLHNRWRIERFSSAKFESRHLWCDDGEFNRDLSLPKSDDGFERLLTVLEVFQHKSQWNSANVHLSTGSLQSCHETHYGKLFPPTAMFLKLTYHTGIML